MRGMKRFRLHQTKLLATPETAIKRFHNRSDEEEMNALDKVAIGMAAEKTWTWPRR